MSKVQVSATHIYRQKVQASHERSRQYGVDPKNPNLGQVHLSPEELAKRRKLNKQFLTVASVHIQDLYRFVAGLGFVVALADSDGYLLDIHADKDKIREYEEANIVPGYRFTERDIGTSAISLVLHDRAPIQLTEKEHFSKRMHNTICSASPVFGENKKLLGVIAISGKADKVHPHTLGMVITAARAIEQQFTITQTSYKLTLRNNLMNAIIESIASGLMAVDRNGIITQINYQGKQILGWHENLVGKNLSTVKGFHQNWKNEIQMGIGYVDREIFIKVPKGVLQIMATARPIFDSSDQIEGMVFMFNEINRIRNLVSQMTGSQARFVFEDIIGVSPSIQEAKRLAMLAAAGRATVLLLGETGTGKELFAHSIHNYSERRNHPFAAINCGAIPRELLESELFGYVDGAFTGARRGGRPGKIELANGGTVFLDEVGDMPVDMQVKLLRVLQSGEVYRVGQHKPISVDLRIIAASHFDLKQEVYNGNFREDLFYRLNVLPITIPPLRERAEDILLIAKHALKRYLKALKKQGVVFSPESGRILTRYHWPGNVRELENVIERSVNLVDGPVIQPAHFEPLILRENRGAASPRTRSLLAETEREAIEKTLEENGYNISRTALALGISRATIYNRLKKYQFSVPR